MYINTVDEVDILLSLDSCFAEVIGVLWDIKTKKQIQKTSPMKIQMVEKQYRQSQRWRDRMMKQIIGLLRNISSSLYQYHFLVPLYLYLSKTVFCRLEVDIMGTSLL